MWSDLSFRLRALFRKSVVERELDEELSFRRIPRVDREQVKEACRDAWGRRWLEDWRKDLRYAARSQGKSRGFTAVAVLSLALGIGANMAIFQLLDALRLRPPCASESILKVWRIRQRR